MRRRLLGLLLDALGETTDHRSLQIVCALALLVVLMGAGLGFEPIPFEQVAQREIPRFLGGPLFRAGQPPVAVRVVQPEGDGAYRAAIDVLDAGEARHLLRVRTDQQKLARGAKVGRGSPLFAPGGARDARPLDDREAHALFALIGESLNYGYTGHEALHGRPGRYHVRFRPPYPHEVSGGGEISVFGLYRMSIPPRLATNTQRSFADLVLDLQWFVANWVAGFFGILLAIVFTGGLFPAMLRPGAIDLLLARPIGRPALFLARYAGGLLYVFCFTTVLVGGFWLVTSIRSGLWSYGFLLTILSVTLLFAVIYSVSVFWAVLTGSTVTAILMTVVASFCFFVVTAVKDAATQLNQMEAAPEWLVGATRALYWIFPSTSDFDVLNAWCIARAPISAGLREQFLASSKYYSTIAAGPLWLSIGTSALFALVLCSISCWIFCRKEF